MIGTIVIGKRMKEKIEKELESLECRSNKIINKVPKLVDEMLLGYVSIIKKCLNTNDITLAKDALKELEQLLIDFNA